MKRLEGYWKAMKIYTKTGDQGSTGLFGGERVLKDHIRIEAYGAVDELNSTLGSVAVAVNAQLQSQIMVIQNELFQLGAELATPNNKKCAVAPVGNSNIERLEKEIDAMEKSLRPLQNFILPGGSEGAARLHITRSVCRRAERRVISLHQVEPVRPEVIQYLNRLADYLFVCARFANFESKVADIDWKKPTSA